MKEVNNSGNNIGYDWLHGNSDEVPEGIPVPNFSNMGPPRPSVRMSDLPQPDFPEIDPDVQRHADEALAKKIDEVRKEFLYVDPETNEPVPFDEETLKWVEDRFRTPNAAMLQDQVSREISSQTASQIRLNCIDRLNTLQNTLAPEIVVDVLLEIHKDMKDLFYYEDVKSAIEKQIGVSLGSFPREELRDLSKALKAGPPLPATFDEIERWDNAYELLVDWDDKFTAQ